MPLIAINKKTTKHKKDENNAKVLKKKTINCINVNSKHKKKKINVW